MGAIFVLVMWHGGESRIHACVLKRRGRVSELCDMKQYFMDITHLTLALNDIHCVLCGTSLSCVIVGRCIFEGLWPWYWATFIGLCIVVIAFNTRRINTIPLDIILMETIIIFMKMHFYG